MLRTVSVGQDRVLRDVAHAVTGGCARVLEVICCDCSDRRRPHRVLAEQADRVRRPAANLAAQVDRS